MTKILIAIEKAWPIGSVYTTTINANPSSVFGFGIWEAFAAGRVQVGYLAGDPNFGTAGGTGGTASLTIDDHAHHTHTVTANVSTTTGDVQSGAGATVVTSATGGASTTSNESPTLTHKSGGQPIKLLPPYVVVYFWKRTA